MHTTEKNRLPLGTTSRNPDPDQRTATTIELEDLVEHRTRCEVWTRVMGYHRPVSAFNPGKQAEHAERTYFEERTGSR
jgi:hypothetical protein